jgi:hypothetical protein
MLTAATVALGVWAAAGCSGGDAAPSTTVEVTLTTSADADPVVLGDELLTAAGARDAVLPGEGAEERIVELGATWCATAERSDVDNADATFRYSLNEFFTDWGLAPADGEVQDVPLAKAMLAGTYADALAQASNDLLCPEVGRSSD